MDTLSLPNLIQLGILIVAIIAVIVSSCWSRKALEIARKQAELQYQFQFFAEYTKRYQNLILQMPDNLDTSSIYNKDVDIYMRLYFDLCSEEHYLHTKGVIDDFVWGLWSEGIQTAMKRPNYKSAWKLLGGYYSDTSFISFMSDMIRKNELRNNT